MTQINVEYENLKDQIIRETQDSLDLVKVKNYFSSVINSRRKLSLIKSLNDIFHLLEERDAMGSNNVYVLKYLGSLLGNETVTNLVHGYEKLYVEEETCSCGRILIFPLPVINPERVQNNSDELELAVSNVALNIGNSWRVLASELDIRECYIDQIREKYPTDFQQQALKALEIWRKFHGEAATLGVLKHALESRLCKRKGIGLHMLKPFIVVE